MNKLDFRSQPSSNTVTDEEQAAIDAWLAKNNPTKIPTGYSAMGIEYRWVTAPGFNSVGGALKAINRDGSPMTREQVLSKIKAGSGPVKTRKPKEGNPKGIAAGHEHAREIGKRNRQKVADGIAAGHITTASLMEYTGLKSATIGDHLRALGFNLIKLQKEARRNG